MPSFALRSARSTGRASSRTPGRRSGTRDPQHSVVSRPSPRQPPRARRTRGSRRGGSRERVPDRRLEPDALLFPVDGAREGCDDLSLTVDHERLGKARHAVPVDGVAGAVVDQREGELVAPRESAGVGTKVLGVEPDDHETAITVLLPHLLEIWRLLLARAAPRRPDVQHDRLAAEGG